MAAGESSRVWPGEGGVDGGGAIIPKISSYSPHSFFVYDSVFTVYSYAYEHKGNGLGVLDAARTCPEAWWLFWGGITGGDLGHDSGTHPRHGGRGLKKEAFLGPVSAF